MVQYNHNSPELKIIRKELRNNLTPAEASLWKALKNKQLDGRRFRRQFSIGNFIVDFYCFDEKLAIELDGAYHQTVTGENFDIVRDNYLKKQGITVLRFENKDVFENFDSVLEKIKLHYRKK